MNITIGVLALQGAFAEHLVLLEQAAACLDAEPQIPPTTYIFLQVRNESQLFQCDGLIIPGGESTTISLVAARGGLLEPLRDFVKVSRRPTWGTCAGLILLAETANATKTGGQDLIGGLDVRVNRNHFGRQTESFQAALTLPFLDNIGTNTPFPGVFIRAPIVEAILPHVSGWQEREDGTVVAPLTQAVDGRLLEGKVRVMGRLGGRVRSVNLKADAGGANGMQREEGDVGDIIAVQQGNVFGTSFHPELTGDMRIHVWWLRQVRDRMVALPMR